MGALLEGQVGKICIRLWRESGWEVKLLKTVAASEHFLVEPRKICTRLWRESRLEVKLVERWHDGSTFGRSGRQNLHHAVARERLGSQNR